MHMYDSVKHRHRHTHNIYTILLFFSKLLLLQQLIKNWDLDKHILMLSKFKPFTAGVKRRREGRANWKVTRQMLLQCIIF